MADDLPVALGDPGTMGSERDKKRPEVLGQETGVAIQGVNFAD
jgi:hypothetical protein